MAQQPWWQGGGTHQMERKGVPGSGPGSQPGNVPYPTGAGSGRPGQYPMGPHGPTAALWGQQANPSPNTAYGTQPPQQYPTGPNGPQAVAWGQQAVPSPNASVPQGQQYPMGPSGPLAALWGQQSPASPQGAAPAGMQIQTSIEPTQPYSDQYINQAQNMAGATQTPTMQYNLAQNLRPGVSALSPMTQYGAGRDYGQQMAQAQFAPQQVGQQLGFANSMNLLQDQIARNQEALGWGQLGAQGMGNQMQYDTAMRGNLLNFLQSLSRWWA